MRRFLLVFTALVVLPFACAAGCNAILGNEPGTLDQDATASSACAPTQKSCVGACVEQSDPTVGCSGPCSACPSPTNGQSVCAPAGGKYNCSLGACNAQYGNCNDNPSDGCETHTTVRAHCGDCTTNCGGEFCEHQGGGTYACSATCDPPNIVCGGDAGDAGTECIDPTSDNANCGGCGTSCTVANGVGACLNSACDITCDPHYFLCDGQCVAPSAVLCGASCAPCPAGSLCDTIVGTGDYGTCVVQDSGVVCASGQTCGVANTCCPNSTDNCCPPANLSGATCTTETAISCGVGCDNCGPGIGDVDGGFCDSNHQCSCGANQRCGMGPFWCCAQTDTCGTVPGGCVPKSSCNPPGNCTISTANTCGCVPSGGGLCQPWDTPQGCGSTCAVCEGGAPVCYDGGVDWFCGPATGNDSGVKDAGSGSG